MLSKESNRKSSIERSLDILECFTSKDYSRSLEELTKETKIPKTTVFRTLTYLENYGYIKKESINGKLFYSLGYTFLEKSQLVKDNINIRELAKSEMILLRNDTNLTVQLAIREGTEAVYIEQIESWRPIRLYPSIGKKVPLYVAACPRVLLSNLEMEEQDFLIDRFNYMPVTTYTPISPEKIRSLLFEVKSKGYSMSKGELFVGTFAIAVPVMNPHTGECIAALSIIGLESDFEDEVDKYIKRLKETAESISNKIQS